jgi:hypothetical protein
MAVQKPLVVDNGTTQNLPTGDQLDLGAFTLPATDGTANQVLQTNGAGTVSWATVSGGGGGGGSLNPVRSANLGPSGTNTRAYSTTYQNTTGVAIWVQIIVSKTATGTLFAFADADAAPVNANTALVEAWSVVGGYAATLGFYVPSGQYYKVRDDTTSTIGQWFEYQLLGSGNTPITTISTTTTLGASDYTVLCSATLTVNLPAAASSSGQVYNIKNIGSGTTITIDPNASETIDGATTYTLSAQYESVTIQSNGTAWFIL